MPTGPQHCEAPRTQPGLTDLQPPYPPSHPPIYLIKPASPTPLSNQATLHLAPTCENSSMGRDSRGVPVSSAALRALRTTSLTNRVRLASGDLSMWLSSQMTKL